MKPPSGPISVGGVRGEPRTVLTSPATSPAISPDQAVRAEVNSIFRESGVDVMVADRLRTLTGVNLPVDLPAKQYGYNFGVVKTSDGKMSTVIEYPNPHRDRAREPATLQEFFKITEDGTEESPGRQEFPREILLDRGRIDHLEEAYQIQKPAEAGQEEATVEPSVPYLVGTLQRYDSVKCYITQRGLIVTWGRTPEESEPLGEGEMRGNDGRYNLVIYKSGITSDMVAEVEKWLSRQPEGDLKNTVAARFANYQQAVRPTSY